MAHIAPASTASPVAASGGASPRQADLDSFLQLLITELRNQDPLDPVENSELLQQVSLIRNIQATDQLVNAIHSVLASNQLATAASLIGRRVQGLADDGTEIEGIVQRVSMQRPRDDGPVQWLVQVGDESVRLENVRWVAEQSSRTSQAPPDGLAALR